MNLEEFYNFASSLPQAIECFPFGEDILVFKVNDKIFAICFLPQKPSTIILKCDPQYSISLQEQHPQITPGYHMNKKHWISVQIDPLPSSLVQQLVQNSYNLVSLHKKKIKKIE